MQSVAWVDALPKYQVATDAQARAIRPLPDTAAAQAELLRLCAACTPEEIAAVLGRIFELDGRYRERRFVGIVATLRGDWAGLPARGPLFEFEWYHLWPGGALEMRVRYGEWLREALEAARERERTQ